MKTEIVAMNEGYIRILIILLQNGVVSCLLRAGFVGLEQKVFASSFPLHAVTPHSITNAVVQDSSEQKIAKMSVGRSSLLNRCTSRETFLYYEEATAFGQSCHIGSSGDFTAMRHCSAVSVAGLVLATRVYGLGF